MANNGGFNNDVDPYTGAVPMMLGQRYVLANNVATLAAGASTTPFPAVQKGTSYLLDVSATFGSGASISLQALGSDGVTWRNVATGITASGTYATVLNIMAGSTLRLTAVGGTVTGLYAVLG